MSLGDKNKLSGGQVALGVASLHQQNVLRDPKSEFCTLRTKTPQQFADIKKTPSPMNLLAYEEPSGFMNKNW